MGNVLDCDIIVSEFELISPDYDHLWFNTVGKSINLFIPWILQLVLFYKYSFGIEYTQKVDMPSNKETKKITTYTCYSLWAPRALD